ncbi:MAG TPA: hypothetical protein VFN43_02680 [Humibacillus sp.]|nr:hypothetical protein [Humibacillus sp.]
MKGLLRPLGALVVAVATAFALSPPAGAHGGEEGLVLDPSSTWPGGVLSVRGDLPTTSSIRLVLVGARHGEVTLAQVEDPAQGHFEAVVTVPPTTASGVWHLHAVAGGVVLAETELTVTAASPAGVGQDDRAEPVAASGGSAGRALSAVRPDAVTLSAGEGSTGRWWPYAVLSLALIAAVAWVSRRHAPQLDRVRLRGRSR